MVINLNNWNFTGATFGGDPQPVKRQSGIRISHINDGTSKTLIIGEKRMNTRYLSENPPNDNEGYACGWNHDTLRNTTNGILPDFNDETIGETVVIDLFSTYVGV